jgi:signal transduction histidine kinase
MGLVAVLSTAWLVTFLLLDHPLSADTTTFLPLGIFLIPVLYASITFGLGGGLVLAMVSGVATIPWALESLSQRDTLGAWFDLVQVVVLVVVAYFVGKAVRAERQARETAERSRQDHLLAEVRYHDLFDTNSQPILLADLYGFVHEANVAARDLFGAGTAPLTGASLPDLLGRDLFATLRAGLPLSGVVEVPGKLDGAPGAVFRAAGRLVTIDGGMMVQVVLQDVTEDSRRRQLAQAYAADVLRGQEDERRRIAQELHDGPLQTLVHICRLIDAAAGPRRRPLPERRASPPTLVQLRAATESVVAEVRQISRGLRPPLLDDLGLLAALQRLCDDVELRAGVAASLRVQGTVPGLSPPVELTLYRIAQEALSNVDRHAGASTVEVRLWEADGWVQLQVVDDGDGFDAAPGSPKISGSTLGLSGMSERAELVGGSLQVSSRPGQGTVVTVAIPLAAAAGGSVENAFPAAPGVHTQAAQVVRTEDAAARPSGDGFVLPAGNAGP